MYIIPGKKSASWQLFAVVMGGLKRCYVATNDVKMPNATQNQRKKVRLISKDNFLVAVVFEIFPVYEHTIYTC